MPVRLDDEQYLRFLTDGYVVLQPELDDAFHDDIYRRAQSIYEQVGSPARPDFHLELAGDNLLARIPELGALLEDPVVDGALASILGESYALHPHHFVHQAAPFDQIFHQDGNLPWNERGHYRAHRPDWAMLFYYPQAVDAGNGPTEVVAGSQYWTRDFEKPDGRWHAGDPLDRELASRLRKEPVGPPEIDVLLQTMIDALGIPALERRFVHVPRGAVIVAHYDIVHRGTRHLGGAAPRYMFKFYAARTKRPVAPSWHHEGAEPDLLRVREELRPVVRAAWRWSAGRPIASDGAAGSELAAKREHERIRAAYELGAVAAAGSPRALEVLTRSLDDTRESVRRAAGYGLSLVGPQADSALCAAARSARVGTRRVATLALGSSFEPRSEAATDALLERLQDQDDLVRSSAAYGLGLVLRGPAAPAERIVDALLDRLEPGVESDNTRAAGLSRSTVRDELAAAVLQGASNHRLDSARCERIARLGLGRIDRYVNGLVIEALSRQPDATLASVAPFLKRRSYQPARMAAR